MKRQPTIPSSKLRVQWAKLNEAQNLLTAAAQLRRFRPSVPTMVREAQELLEAVNKVHKYHEQRVRPLRRQIHKMEHTEASAESKRVKKL